MPYESKKSDGGTRVYVISIGGGREIVRMFAVDHKLVR